MTHTVDQKLEAFKRIKDTIHSCRTRPHLESAMNMIVNFCEHYADSEDDAYVVVLEGFYTDQVSKVIPNEQITVL